MGRKSTWTPERIARLEKHAMDGIPTTELATMFEVSRQRLYQIMEEHQIDTPKRRRKQRGLSQPEYRMWKNLTAIKARTKKSNLEFSIELEDLLPLPTECPVLGIPIDYSAKRGGHYSENSPSVDRIDSSKGYIKGNVVIMSWRANRIKNDGTAEEHLKVYNFMKRK